jgi:hypothetical protein
MGNPKGDFIWYELLTPDADAAQRFYGDVVGWTVSDSGQPGMDYRILEAGDGPAGGLMQITDQMPGMQPVWLRERQSPRSRSHPHSGKRCKRGQQKRALARPCCSGV